MRGLRGEGKGEEEAVGWQQLGALLGEEVECLCLHPAMPACSPSASLEEQSFCPLRGEHRNKNRFTGRQLRQQKSHQGAWGWSLYSAWS